MKLGVLVYLEHRGRVLMIHRRKEDEHKGYWLAPGGKLDKNEAPLETAYREFYEETGLEISGISLKALLSFPNYGDSPFGDEWQVFVFHANEFEGELLKNCPEGQLEWIPLERLSSLPMWEGDRLFTPRVFKRGFFMAKLEYRLNTLKNSIFWETEEPDSLSGE